MVLGVCTSVFGAGNGAQRVLDARECNSIVNDVQMSTSLFEFALPLNNAISHFVCANSFSLSLTRYSGQSSIFLGPFERPFGQSRCVNVHTPSSNWYLCRIFAT